MNNRVASFYASLGLAICASFTSLTSFVVAQAQDPERPKLKDFGSSLKRLKWDPERNATVETKRKDDKARSSDEVDVVRVETTLVVCDVLVLDQQGRSVQGLTPTDFVVTEDGKPQQVGMFSLGDDAKVPRSIVLLIDYSPSQTPFINTSIKAAKTLVDKLGPLDTMAIVTDDVEMLVDFTADKHKLKDELESLRKRAIGKRSFLGGFRPGREGLSAQYSALMATLKEAFNNEDQRPIIIFQTDGDEALVLRNSIIIPSAPPNLPPDIQKQVEQHAEVLRKAQRDKVREFSINDVFKAAEKSRATIYTVVPGFRLLGLSRDEQVKKTKAGALGYMVEQALKVQWALSEVATLSGGWAAFLEQPSQADEIYTRILSDINRRYVIGYYPTNKEHDGKRRRVNVEVRGHPEYTVMGRKSYFAPDPEP